MSIGGRAKLSVGGGAEPSVGGHISFILCPLVCTGVYT